MKMIALLLACIVGVVLVTVALGSLRWRRTSADLIARLDAAGSSTHRVFDESDLGGLPEPVIRYFRHVLMVGQPDVSRVRLTQEGTFRMGDDEDGWRPFEASQYYSTAPVGFIWDARIRIAPFVNVNVRDAYQGGAASMRAAVSVFPVVNAHGAPELNAGALQRYLAEAAWFPTALLPGRGVLWEHVDYTTARGSISDSGTTVSLDFRFNEQGEIVSVFAPTRFREVKGRYEPTPWTGRFWNYQERDGIRIPQEGEVAWQLGNKTVPYWRGKLLEVEYHFGMTP